MHWTLAGCLRAREHTGDTRACARVHRGTHTCALARSFAPALMHWTLAGCLRAREHTRACARVHRGTHTCAFARSFLMH
eukprot:3994147-Alexandrium_andersonii.AAC.1